MEAVQLRLLPPPKPLLWQLGEDFFKKPPRQPGVYLMGDGAGRILYIGQSQNLRARLNSYKNLDPERSSRKLVRLVHRVRSITWETCRSPEAARLRENELLRLHKPLFNRLNAHPEHYAFVGFAWRGDEAALRMTKKPVAEPDEQLFGAFKSPDRVRRSLRVLARLLRLVEKGEFRISEMPGELLSGKCPERFRVQTGSSAAKELVHELPAFFGGQSDAFLDRLIQSLPDPEDAPAFALAFYQHDLEQLRDFYDLACRRTHVLRDTLAPEEPLILSSDLDDLLVLAKRD